MDYSLPGSSVLGILQARILEQVVIQEYKEPQGYKDIRLLIFLTKREGCHIWSIG